MITPTNVTGQGYPGMDVVYVMNVANRGTLSDTFDLQFSSNWTATLSAETIGPLEPDEEATLVLTVTVPALCQFRAIRDTAVITATSQYDPDKFAVATRTTLAQWRGAEIEPETASAVGSPGETITYTLTVTNVGDITDTFAVSAEADWLTSVAALVGPLEPGGSTPVQVAVTIPEDAASGDSDTASILFHSELPGSLDAWATLTTTAQADYSLQVTAEDDTMTASAAAMPVTFTLHLTNTGSVTDTYDLTITSTWTVEYSSPIGPLAAGESQTIFVVVQVPPDAIIGDMNVATLRFTSQADPLVSRQLDLTTLFVWYNLSLPIIVK